jgi:sulfate transport system permease protein
VSALGASLPNARRRSKVGGGGALTLGVTTLWLSVIVLLPLAALVERSFQDGLHVFWTSATSKQAVSALKFTVLVSLAVAVINVVMGTLIAWVLARDEFPGKRLLNGVIDLPFALPTIVAGLVLLSLYGSAIAFTKWAVLMALLFVTLPFVVRAVQPVLIELGHADIRQQAVRHPGVLGLRLQAARVRQHHGRRGRLGRAPGGVAARADRTTCL